MTTRADEFDLGALRLTAGEGRRIELSVGIDPLELGGERYEIAPEQVPVKLEVSRMIGGGYALKLSFAAALTGTCMRCLQAASPQIEVEAREIDTLQGAGKQGEEEELESPYVDGEKLDLAAWARDAFVLAAPVKILCKENCAGLCPICALNLNDLDPAGAEHRHEPEPDPRWAKLGELKLE